MRKYPHMFGFMQCCGKCELCETNANTVVLHLILITILELHLFIIL